ncbi:MAG TPA: transglutaminase family protein, partial [Aggregatilineales bacterium]|nr:transglutaminase family protein [Aggregatilineales bacterium]
RADELQRCLSFRLEVQPATQLLGYRDYLHNTVHHFGLPRLHQSLHITAESHVQMTPRNELPTSLPKSAWDDLDMQVNEGDFWEFVIPSHFVQPSALLFNWMNKLDMRDRRDDPLTMMTELCGALHDNFTYAPDTTKVDSPIEQILTTGEGVCQDYSHVMIAMARHLRIPCRYVSGYLFIEREEERHIANDASHAWVEAFLPELGWVGFDPTNNQMAGHRHIRVALGRDYHDVPPTRGVYKGNAITTLRVGVGVYAEDKLAPIEELSPPMTFLSAEEIYMPGFQQDNHVAQQQQQQQQQ